MRGKFTYDESYIGNKYNHLKVIGYDYNEYGKRCFKCRCDCGNIKLYVTTNVVQGTVKSCGCMHDEYVRINTTKHGGCSNGVAERLYRVYRSMIERCTNPNHIAYKNYGGMGISVCNEWRKDYSKFRKWALDNGYDETKDRKEQSIDRIDNNKGYSPDNCRWTTAKVQRSNQRPRKAYSKRAMVNIDGKLIPKREICAQYGISPELFDYRRKHMSIIEALTMPIAKTGRKRKII